MLCVSASLLDSAYTYVSEARNDEVRRDLRSTVFLLGGLSFVSLFH